MDSLKPADMPAVLERTNLKVTTENFLLPIYEAISNGIYSAQNRWGSEVAEKGRVSVSIKTGNFQVVVVDNGHGLDAENYGYFLTPFTGFRLRKGGKGFGRFIAFKVFQDITYASAYMENGEKKRRKFRFDIYDDPQIQDDGNFPALAHETGCAVKYEYPKPEFDHVIEELTGEDIVERTIRYFLPFFLSGEMPDLAISVDGASFDARSHFAEFFSSEIQETVDIEFEDGTESFSINISKVPKERLFNAHMMLLFADGRIIGSGRKISGKIGNDYFEAPDGSRQIYIASISGEFLDKRANTARTEIEATNEEIDSIVEHVTDLILGKETEFVERHRTKQTQGVTNAIMKNPLLRSGLKNTALKEYVSKKPMSWRAEDFVADLALMRFREQNTWQKELQEGLKAPEKLVALRNKIQEQLNEENKDALASYVAHRKSVLELAEAYLGYQENGRMSLEDMFHDLVYPRYEDSETTKFYQHNLWLLDDKLAFVSYCSSDRTLHGKRRQKGDKVADLVFFDDCSIYQEQDENAVILVEFKRPGREEYRFGDIKKDPVQQVIETAVQIREAERLITESGRTIRVPPGTRLYAYVVADLEPPLRNICESHDMHDSWDKMGFYRYHEKKDIFIEVLGYDKLLNDAQKRNAAFFDVLLGELVK